MARATGHLSRRRLLGLVAGATITGGLGIPRPAATQTPRNPFWNPAPAALIDLLACVPEELADQADAGLPSSFYTDFQQQLDAFGIEPVSADGDIPDGWLYVTRPLPPVSQAYANALRPEFASAIGFQPLAVEQALSIGDRLQGLTPFRGGIDLASLPAAWEAAGYERANTQSGHNIWTLGGPEEFSLTHPIQMAVFSRFNAVTILDGGILAYAADVAVLDRAAATRLAGSGSLATEPAFAELLATLPATTVACQVVPGSLMGVVADMPMAQAWSDALAESDRIAGPMPAWRRMVTGATAGIRYDEPGFDLDSLPRVPADGNTFFRIQADSPDDAAQVARVIEHRWASGESIVNEQPFSELMPIAAIEVHGSIAAIEFEPGTGAGFWSRFVISGDVFPLFYDGA